MPFLPPNQQRQSTTTIIHHVKKMDIVTFFLDNFNKYGTVTSFFGRHSRHSYIQFAFHYWRLSRPDYRNTVLVGLPAYLFRWLQLVMIVAKLALLTGQSAVQGGCAYVQSFTWICYDILMWNGLCCWSTRSLAPPLCMDQSTSPSIYQTVFHRQPGLSNHRPTPLHSTYRAG